MSFWIYFAKSISRKKDCFVLSLPMGMPLPKQIRSAHAPAQIPSFLILDKNLHVVICWQRFCLIILHNWKLSSEVFLWCYKFFGIIH